MAANKEKGEVSFSVGEGDEKRVYKIVLNFHAWALVQDKLTDPNGSTFPTIERIMALAQAGHLYTILATFWAGMQRYHSREFPTVEAASQFMEDTKGEAANAVRAALKAAQADDRDVHELMQNSPRPTDAQADAAKADPNVENDKRESKPKRGSTGGASTSTAAR